MYANADDSNVKEKIWTDPGDLLKVFFKNCFDHQQFMTKEEVEVSSIHTRIFLRQKVQNIETRAVVVEEDGDQQALQY